MVDVYTRLAHFLDDLPAGYPATESGVELHILRRLFTPEEAALFVHLSLLNESPRVIAYRAQRPLEDVTALLEEMERKGLVGSNQKPGKPAEYAANQFVVGFMEEQVNHLDHELAEMLEAYLPEFFKRGPWFKLPQLRTIPVGESIPVQTNVMAYERAGEIVRAHTDFAVRNCVCRQERQALDKGCDKPLEMCLSFDLARATPSKPGAAVSSPKMKPLRCSNSPMRPGWCSSQPIRRTPSSSAPAADAAAACCAG